MTDKPTAHGVIAPLLTPFAEDGGPDPARFLAHAKFLLRDGCNALAIFGTTGEANSLSFAERKRLLEGLVEGGIDPKQLMVGTGTCALPETVEATRHARGLGCDAVLMLPPFYYKVASDDGLFAYMSEVVQQVADPDLDIYLYHIPPVAQVGFSLPLIERLVAAYPQTIVGYKDSSGDWNNMKAVLDTLPGFRVFVGSEIFLLDNLRAGGVGTITATANVFAGGIRLLYDNWRGVDADRLQDHITSVRQTIQARPMIPILKAIVAHYTADPGWTRLRLPFQPLDAGEASAAIAELEEVYGFKLEAA